MKISILFVILTLLSLRNSFAEDTKTCHTVENFSDLVKLSDQMSPVLGLTESQDIPQFCQINGLRDRRESLRVEDNDFSNGWVNSMTATADKRLNSFIDGYSGYIDLRPISKNIKEIAMNIETQPDEIAKSELDILLQKINYFEKNNHINQKEKFSLATAQFAYACSDFTLLRLKSCIKGLEIVKELATPKESVTLVPIWKEIYSDPLYLKVFKKVSLKIVNHLQGQTIPKSTQFEDFKSEFLKATGDAKKAEDYAWNAMAILATGGGNVHLRPGMMDANNRTLLRYLFVLSNGAMALDRVSAPKGFLYTYPKQVNNLCDYGKNYHFWMTAFLARQVAREIGDPEAAAAAAFSAQKGYQFSSTTVGRDPTKPFTQDTFSTYNNNMRLDLSLASAGAWFGATADSSTQSLSRDQVETGIRKTFSGSKMLPRDTEVKRDDFNFSQIPKTMDLFSKWKKIINSDESYDYFKKQYGY